MPLTEATLASMRPQLVEEYNGIVQEYREAGWGIYEDSPDMDRAIAISDAYYGDNSSIVWLYQQTREAHHDPGSRGLASCAVTAYMRRKEVSPSIREPA